LSVRLSSVNSLVSALAAIEEISIVEQASALAGLVMVGQASSLAALGKYILVWHHGEQARTLVHGRRRWC
jgi:hypothetical protein